MITKVLNITDQNNSLSRPARILLMVQYTSKLRQKVKKDIGETIQNVCARQGNRLVVIQFFHFFFADLSCNCFAKLYYSLAR